jgi:Spy/CpxP family protein refolding chaperone
MTRSRLTAAGLLLAVFALGAVAGGVGVSVAEHRGQDAGRSRTGRDGYLTRLTTELSLTAAQQDSVRAIMTRHEPAMDSMWREMRPRFDSLRGVVRGEIMAQLNPEQQGKYQESIERRDRAYRERRANGGR